jgi:hypothetical protein
MNPEAGWYSMDVRTALFILACVVSWIIISAVLIAAAAMLSSLFTKKLKEGNNND